MAHHLAERSPVVPVRCSRSRQRRRRLLAAGLLAAALWTEAVEAQRILILHSFNRDFAPYNNLSSFFRTELAQALPEPVEFYEESLDAARLGEMDTQAGDAFLDYLNNRFAEHRPDLLVTLGGPAAHFSLRHRRLFFPATPMLVAGIESRHLRSVALTENEFPLTLALDFPAVFEHILKVLPETRKIAVVVGASGLEKFWEAEMRRDLRGVSERVELEWLSTLSLEEIKRRAGSLPPSSAILYGMLAIDGAGIPHEQDLALTSLHEVANAPIFGLFDTQLGLGIVGGPVVPLREVGARSVAAALCLLRGQMPTKTAAVPLTFDAPAYDWHELVRWRIPEERLPAGNLVRFRPRSPWQEYRTPILAGTGLVAMQALLILALLVQRARARKAEQSSHILSNRLMTVCEDERCRVARELHDDITQRLAGLAMEAATIERAATDDSGRKLAGLGELRAELGRLSEDVHTLSYQLHPTVLDNLGLPQALRGICDRFAETESVPVRFITCGVPPDLPRSAALSLFRVAQEALRNVARHAHANAVEVSLMMVDGGVQLTVGDDGVGFDLAESARRSHLGHASMRERVSLVGGELDIDTSIGNGTLIVAWIPMEGKRYGKYEK